MTRRLVFSLAVVFMLVAPHGAYAQSTAELVAAEVDAWWAAEFAARGLTYGSPRLEIVSEPGTEFCGFFDVFFAPAGYCAPNNTITVSTGFVSPEALTANLTLISHEWGHHIQQLTDTGAATPIEQELQADCFAGAFIEYARQSDLVSPVIGALALQLSQSAGDVWWAVPFDEAIHGTQSDRAMAFIAGQTGGLEACGL